MQGRIQICLNRAEGDELIIVKFGSFVLDCRGSCFVVLGVSMLHSLFSKSAQQLEYEFSNWA